MILRAGSTGTEVNSAITSYEQTLAWLEGNPTYYLNKIFSTMDMV